MSKLEKLQGFESFKRRQYEREADYIPGRALELSRSVVTSAVNKRTIGEYFHINPMFISDETLATVNRRFTTIGAYLIEEARLAPQSGAMGSYEAATEYVMKFGPAHEIIHAGVRFMITDGRDFIPFYLSTRARLTADEQVFREEAYADAFPFYLDLLKNNPSISFEESMHRYKENEHDFLRDLNAAIAKEEGVDSDEALDEFENSWNRIEEFDPEFVDILKNIYDGYKTRGIYSALDVMRNLTIFMDTITVDF